MELWNLNKMSIINCDDWRLQGQERYMMNLMFHYAVFPIEKKDHAHCEFCWQKIGYWDDTIKYGYESFDGYRWVCEQCFHDFKEMVHLIEYED